MVYTATEAPEFRLVLARAQRSLSEQHAHREPRGYPEAPAQLTLHQQICKDSPQATTLPAGGTPTDPSHPVANQSHAEAIRLPQPLALRAT